MSYTKEMRDAKEEVFMPHVVVEGNRMYLTQRMYHGTQVKIDATGLYYFLKEMFTTDWEATQPKGRKRV